MLNLITVTVKPHDHSKRPYQYQINPNYHRPFAFPEKRRSNPYKLPCGRLNVASGDSMFEEVSNGI